MPTFETLTFLPFSLKSIVTMLIVQLPREILDHILEFTLPDESRNTTPRYKKLTELCQVNSTFRSVSQAALFRNIRFKSVKMESIFYESLLCGDLECVSGLVRSIFWAEIGNKISLVTLLSRLPQVQSITIYWPSDILQISSISTASHCKCRTRNHTHLSELN